MEGEEERKFAEVSPNIYSQSGRRASAALLVILAGIMLICRPAIRQLLDESHTSLEELDDDDDNLTSTFRRQRQFVASAKDSLFADQLLRAQKEEGEEKLDVNFTLAFDRLAPAGYVAADDYDDDGKEEEPRGGQKSNGAVRSWNSQARREAASVGPAATVERRRQYRSVIPGGSGAGVREAGQGKGGAGGHNSDRRELEEDIEDPAQAKGQVLGASSRHSGFTLRRRRYQPEPAAEPPGVEPGGQQDPRPTEQTQQSATTESGANLGLTVLKMAPEAFDLEFVNSNGQHYGYQSNEGPMKVWESPKWPLKKDPKWQAPPNVCPGKPTKKSMADGAPGKRKSVEHAIDLMAQGMVQVNNTHIIENRCMYFSKDCGNPDLPYGAQKAMKQLKMGLSEFQALRRDKLPDLKPRMFGSCALVANGENLLAGNRGADIDGHDTIFRHNTPVKGYEKAVGSRKSSIMWVKAKYMRQLKSAGNEAERMYDLLLGIDKVPKSFSYKGKPLLIVNKEGGYNDMVRERIKWYKLAGAKAKNHPSGGFARPLSILASGLCTRVDLYGFSSKPSGKYFQRGFKVLPTHLMKFEHWVYRYLQKTGKLCVYGE